MAVEIYHLPPGTEKAKRDILARAVETLTAPDYSGIYYLAPTKLFIDLWKKQFHKIAGPVYIPPVSITPVGLSMRLFRDSGRGRVIGNEFIPLVLTQLTGQGLGYATLVTDFISECKGHFPGQTVEQIKNEIFKASQGAGLHEAVSGRIAEALDSFAKYQDALAARNLADHDDVLVQAAGLASSLDIELLILDGFYESTPAEESFLSALAHTAHRTIVTVPISSRSDDLKYCYTNRLKEKFCVEPVTVMDGEPAPAMNYDPASSLEDEVETIARRIKSDFISGKDRKLEDTLVVFPSLAPYESMVERVFKRYGIPFEMSGRRPLIQLRPYRDLLALLECAVDDFPRLAFTQVLTSPHFRAISGELRSAAPYIALNAGLVKGLEAWRKSLNNEKVEKKFGNNLKEPFRKFTKRLLPILNHIKLDTFSYFSDVLIEVLRALSFQTSENEGLSEAESIIGKLGLLDEFCGGEVTLADYADALRQVLMKKTTSSDGVGVRIASLFDVRGVEPGMLYAGGLKDGDIPSTPAMDYLLPDPVRKALGFRDIERHMHLEERIFRRLSRSAREPRLSYPSMEGDKLYLPSVFLAEAKERRIDIPAVLSEQESQLHSGARSGVPLASKIIEVQDIKRYTEDSPFRATEIDAYRSCPRRFFIERVLSLEPSDLLEYEIEPRELGITIHEVMERLITTELGALDAFRARAESVLDEVLLNSSLDGYLKSLLRETFLVLVPEIYDVEEKIREEGYIFDKAEELMDAEPLPGVRLRGKVDRIDRSDANRAEVIDYKTGGMGLIGSRVLTKGENLQLFLYAAMLKAQGYSPKRVGIYSLKDIHLKWVPSVVDIRKGVSLDDLVVAALKFLEQTVISMRNGNFPAHPLEDQRCRTCHERPYCPYIQKSESV